MVNRHLFRRHAPFVAGAALILLAPSLAHAAGAGGGNLPWDTPLTTLRNDLTGPFAGTIAILAFVVAGVVLIFGGEISEFIRRLLYVVMVSAMLIGVTNFASALGITGAVF